MIVPGLVSITFRQLDVPAVVELAATTGLKSIEWGGDVHVPGGDLTAAKNARTGCGDAGLQISSYGSYIRVTDDDPPFDQVLETAVALGAPSIRVWAGRGSSTEATANHRRRVAAVIAQAADAAVAQGVTINLEYHRNTLTDTHVVSASVPRRGGPAAIHRPASRALLLPATPSYPKRRGHRSGPCAARPPRPPPRLLMGRGRPPTPPR